MPYYCTVPRCTSMAGKAKNVSFHQFPRDDELAKLWNNILKRGKPYTKYSKVCSLHFRPEDYTITSVGKNKGQWRTLRKDAIPTQNLPSESPAPYKRSKTSVWKANSSQSNDLDPRLQQQVAQAIYMQTMLAMQASGATEAISAVRNGNQPTPPNEETTPENGHPSYISQTEQLVSLENTKTNDNDQKNNSYKCNQCTKCFKDPDVYLLHKRLHLKNEGSSETHCGSEKENVNQNQETLKANPILANLLKTQDSNIFDRNVFENQLMAALAVTMDNYMRMSMRRSDQDEQNCDIEDMESNKLVIDESV